MDPATAYQWKNRLNTLVFLFTFHTYRDKQEMIAFVYALHGDDIGSLQRESRFGTIAFIDAVVSGYLLNGDLWIESGENNEYKVHADLCYGPDGAEQELEGVMFVYTR